MSVIQKNDISLLNDDEWLEYIIDQYGGELFRIAYSYLKEWKLAEDAIQEVYIKCYLKRRNFRGDSSLKTWIFSILSNTCKDILRSAAYQRSIPFPSSNKKFCQTSSSAENIVLAYEELLLVNRVVLSLSIKYREVVILFYYNGFSIKEISSIIKINESTIKIRLKRAREKIREKILKEEL